MFSISLTFLRIMQILRSTCDRKSQKLTQQSDLETKGPGSHHLIKILSLKSKNNNHNLLQTSIGFFVLWPVKLTLRLWKCHLNVFMRNQKLTTRKTNCRWRRILNLDIVIIVSGVKWRGVTVSVVRGDCGHGASGVSERGPRRPRGLRVFNVAEVNCWAPREVPAASARLKGHGGLGELYVEVAEVMAWIVWRRVWWGEWRLMMMVPSRPLAGNCDHSNVWCPGDSQLRVSARDWLISL